MRNYDTILFRLIQTLTKLSNDERPTTKELAEEFAVGVRTIQKDIYERLYNFPIIKDNSGRFLFQEGFTLNKTVLDQDELIFLKLALSQFDNVSDIDKIKERIFQKLTNANFCNPYFIKQDDIEDLDVDSHFIEQLEVLIKEQAIATLKLEQRSLSVALYKIVNFGGFWYLFAKDFTDNKTKTFKLSEIQKIIPSGKYHANSSQEVENILHMAHSAFYNDGNSFDVTIKVYKEIALYFQRKDFLESQKILEEKEDGSLIISFQVSHDEDIDNIIKAWLPHVEILEPKRFRDKLISELKMYIQKVTNDS